MGNYQARFWRAVGGVTHLLTLLIQAAVNIGMRGIEIVGLGQNKLLVVHQEVTGKSESTDSARNSREKSMALAVEPTNPRQLSLFEWRDDRVIYH